MYLKTGLGIIFCCWGSVIAIASSFSQPALTVSGVMICVGAMTLASVVKNLYDAIKNKKS